MLSWLFKSKDPTREWPQSMGSLPLINLQPFSLGPVRIGSSLDAIRVLGRPDKYVGKNGVARLTWTNPPLEIEMENEQVTCISIPTGYGTFSAASEGEPIAEIRLDSGAVWNQQTHRNTTRQLLGPPSEENNDEGGDEFEDLYCFRDIIISLEFNEDKKLCAFEAYVDTP